MRFRTLEKSKEEGKREVEKPGLWKRTKNAFRKLRPVGTLSLAMLGGSAACGETIHNHYYDNPDAQPPQVTVEPPDITVQTPEVTVNPPEVTVDPPEVNVTVTPESDQPPRSEMCPDETTVVVGSENRALTMNQSEIVRLPNGYGLELTDIEERSQTVFFNILDWNDNLVGYVDMVEGVEYTLTFPEGSNPETVRIAACSVRTGFTLGEKSAALVSDVDLFVQPQDCEPETRATSVDIMYNNDNGDMQNVQTVYTDRCGNREVLSSQATTFSNPIENVGGGISFVNSAVMILDEMYSLLSVDPNSIVIAKLAVRGTIDVGRTLPYGNLLFVVQDVEDDGTDEFVTISVQDASGELASARIRKDDTHVFTINGTDYRLHVFEVAEGHTPGTQWADMAILSEMREVENGTVHVFDLGRFAFHMNFAHDGALLGWQLTRL